MKGKLSALVILISFVLISGSAIAMDKDQDPVIQHGPRFVDLDGDGYNDNAPDHDNDGIPNGQDEDYISIRQQNGVGEKGNWVRGRRFQNRSATNVGPNFVDADGDGVCDNFAQRGTLGKGQGNGMRQQMFNGNGKRAGRGQCRRGPRG